MKYQDEEETEDVSTKKKRTFFDYLKNFLQHSVVVRVIALTVAAVMVGLSGGALIPAIMLIATFVTALIGVVGEVYHRLGLEKIKLQQSLTQKMEKSYDSLMPLRLANKKVFEVLEQQGGPLYKVVEQRKSIERSSNTKIAGRVMRDIGLENFWTVALFATSLNLVGTIAYTAGLILGIGKVSKEYDARVKEEIDKEGCKHLIDARCRKMSIENKNYKDVEGVYEQYKDSLIEHKTLRRMCTPNLNNASEADILEAYQHTRAKVTQETKFALLPAEVSFVANLSNALNPLKPVRVKLFADGQDSNFDGAPKFEEGVVKKSGHEKLGKIVPDSISVSPNRSQRIIR